MRGWFRYPGPRLAMLGAVIVSVILTCAPAAVGQSNPLTLTLAVSITGTGAFYGAPSVDGATLAVEEANAEAKTRPIALQIFDDASLPANAAEIARRLGQGSAPIVIGPSLTVAATVTGPIYAEAGLPSIVSTAHGDSIPRAATTFQAIFNNGQMGSMLADYLFYVLHLHSAVVLFRQDAYGRPFTAGFETAAKRLGIAVSTRGFTTDAEREAQARAAAAEPNAPAIALGVLADDAVPLILALRRNGVKAPILGPDSISGDSFADLFANEPEERSAPGYFTSALYAASPIMFDSAETATLNFVRRFRERFGKEPSWPAIQTYDAARLAIAAMRQMEASLGANAGVAARREAVRDFLASLDGPSHALAGATGPLWFTAARGRTEPIRIGRFEHRLFESAPIQLVPVTSFDAGELAAGAVVDLGDGVVARRQLVAFAGMLLSQVSQLDIAQSRFNADFYLWLRYPEQRDGAVADPDDIALPDLVRGTTDGLQPLRSALLADGSRYRLWKLRGDFRSQFDLRRFPVDQQDLSIRFFNSHAASDSLIYAQDRRSPPTMSNPRLPGTTADAFRELPQWEPRSAVTERAALITQSGLGNPLLRGLEQRRELSGFALDMQIRRRVVPTLLKNLLPLALMSLIVYATLFFPAHLLKEKVTVTVTGALSGAVLLSSINSQLGGLGYTLAVEYLFYAFFVLCLFCIISFVVTERLRVVKAVQWLSRIEATSRLLYAAGLGATVTAAVVFGVTSTGS